LNAFRKLKTTGLQLKRLRRRDLKLREKMLLKQRKPKSKLKLMLLKRKASG